MAENMKFSDVCTLGILSLWVGFGRAGERQQGINLNIYSKWVLQLELLGVRRAL